MRTHAYKPQTISGNPERANDRAMIPVSRVTLLPFTSAHRVG